MVGGTADSLVQETQEALFGGLAAFVVVASLSLTWWVNQRNHDAAVAILPWHKLAGAANDADFFTGISCLARNDCFLSSDLGLIRIGRDGAKTWVVREDVTQGALSCAVSSVCMYVAFDYSTSKIGVWRSSNGQVWSRTTIDSPGSSFVSYQLNLACDNSSNCLLTTDNGWWSWFNGSQWLPFQRDLVLGGSGKLQLGAERVVSFESQTCGISGSCAVVGRLIDGSRDLLLYRNGAWQSGTERSGLPSSSIVRRSDFIKFISCPSVTVCNLLSNDGQLSTFDFHSTVRSIALLHFRVTHGGALHGIRAAGFACVRRLECVIVTDDGYVLNMTGARIMSPKFLTPDLLVSLFCNQNDQCVAADSVGEIFESHNLISLSA